MRSTRVFMALRVTSNDNLREGNDQVLPSGMEPKPLAVFPPAELTTQFTFSRVTWSATSPPNLMGTRYLYAWYSVLMLSIRISVFLGAVAMRITGLDAKPAVT